MNLNIKDLDNALIICPSNYKDKLLERFNKEKTIANISFMSLNEYKKNIFFDYDINAIKFLTQEGLSVNNAKEILSNIVYVEDKKYNNKKLDKLVEYKNKLINKGLLKYNPLFKDYLKTKNVVVVGYGKLNSYDQKLIEGKKTTFITEEKENKKYTINCFKEIDKEVEYLYNCIYDLLEKGIDINNIHILNATSEYNSYFKRYNSYYRFNIKYKENLYLIGTTLAQRFIELLETNDKQQIYNEISLFDNEVSKQLIKILNKYAKYEIEDIKDLIINDIKNTKINIDYKNSISCDDQFTYYNKNDHVFLIGFNDSVLSTEKDIDYITDNIKALVGLPSTEEKNQLKKENLISYISSIDNLYLSYCENSPFLMHNRQIILNDECCEYIKKETKPTYSKQLNKANYSIKLDNLKKYNVIDNEISVFYKEYKKNNYLNYNNRFKGLSNSQINSILETINKSNKEELSLSYSSMNEFYECNFKYYLDHVLKINEPFGTYYTKLGTVCHGVLKDLYSEKDFDFEKSWKTQIATEEKKENKNIFEDESEKYFVDKIKEELRKDIDIVLKQKQNSQLDKQKCENYFSYKANDKVKFIGFIDKVMFKETEDEVLASVVDYKTSKSIEIDKDIMKYGLSLQLPSYLYLINHSKEFNKPIKYIGLYIQHLINYDKKYIEEKDLNKTKEESMKLDGISSVYSDRVAIADINLLDCQKSENIKGISINKDGSLKKSAKLYTDEQFEELLNIVEDRINIAGEAILGGDFSINPKEINGENKSCTYCPYSAICFKRASDLKFISTQEEQ